LVAPDVDVLALIARRATRFYSDPWPALGHIRYADSRNPQTWTELGGPFDWIVTSPPYLGMRTYIPDQWLRLWFLGGPSEVTYHWPGQLAHDGVGAFVNGLRQIWVHAAAVAAPSAHLVVRFGGVPTQRDDPLGVLRASFADTPWRITTIRPAGSASDGRRQAHGFSRHAGVALPEWDVWAQRH